MISNKILSILIITAMASFCFYAKKNIFNITTKYNKTTTIIPESTTLLKVGTNAEYPPFSFIENDTIVGFDIDLINAIAKRLNKKIILHNMSFISLIPQLQMGMIDLIAAGMSPTQERSKYVAFSQPYSTTNMLIAVVPAEKYLEASQDIMKWLKDRNIVVNEGFIADLFISDQGFSNKKLPAVSDALIALRTHQAEAFVTGSISMQPFFEQYGTKEFRSVNIPNTSEPIALVINKKDTQLLAQIQTTLDQLRQEGVLDTLKEKWHIHS